MKLAIRAEGGGSIGMGHLTRCGALARAWGERGHEYRFFTRAASLPLLRAQGLAADALPPCNAISEETDAFIAMARAWDADLALLDSYELTLDCYAKTREALYTAVIDDNARLPYSADALINANLYADASDYADCNVNRLLLGGEYALLREQFRDTAPAPFRENASRVLIIMGGADINGYAPFVLNALGDIRGIVPVAVVGPAADNLERVQSAAAAAFPQAEVHRDPANIAALIASCDIAVASPSTTTLELCALGIPSVLIKQADNQRRILDFFAREGGMIALGDYTDVTSRAIAEAVTYLLADSRARRAMRETLLGRVDRMGALNAADALAAYASAERRSI